MCHQLRCGWLQLELVERAVKVGPRWSVSAGGPARQGVVSGHHVVVRGRHQQNRLQVQRFARSGDANGVRHVGVVNFTWNTSETFFLIEQLWLIANRSMSLPLYILLWYCGSG